MLPGTVLNRPKNDCLIYQLKLYCFLLFTIASLHLTAQDSAPSDSLATTETKNLYRNLFNLAGKGYMVGHQDDLAYGVKWKYKPGRSDIKDVTGDYPALYGWDLGGIERVNSKANLDGVPFKKIRQFIREAYDRGGVSTVSWHADSPLGKPGGAWDTTHGTITSILPGGSNHQLYKTWLDKVAAFFHSLKGSKGEAIPVIFRPYHELTGGWFWWGKGPATTLEFVTLWSYTYYYLTREKNLHNLLWCYNTSGDFADREGFLERYPGDGMVDLISFDTYQYGNPATSGEFAVKTEHLLSILSGIASEKHKLFALGETGYEAIPYAQWWTGTLDKAIGSNRISYVLLWRNHGYHESMKRMHYYVPYKGQVSAADFVKYYGQGNTLFGKDVKSFGLYK